MFKLNLSNNIGHHVFIPLFAQIVLSKYFYLPNHFLKFDPVLSEHPVYYIRVCRKCDKISEASVESVDNVGHPRPTQGHNTLNQRHNELKQSKFCTVFLSVRQRRARQGRTSPPRSSRSIYRRA